MTLTAPKAADYLSDPTLLGLLGWWVDTGEAPLPLVDYLLDQGLTTQAENVRWLIEHPNRGGEGRRPYEDTYRTGWTWWDGGRLENCNCRSDLPVSRFPALFRGQVQVRFDTPTDALIAVIDSE